MSVVLTVELPASEFAIGRVIEAVDGTRIELETVVPFGEQATPVLQVRDRDHDSFAQRLRARPAVVSVVAAERSDDGGTYAVDRAEDLGSFYRASSEHEASTLRAVKDGDRWEFDLRFPFVSRSGGLLRVPKPLGERSCGRRGPTPNRTSSERSRHRTSRSSYVDGGCGLHHGHYRRVSRPH
jgi:hypothetical protein